MKVRMQARLLCAVVLVLIAVSPGVAVEPYAAFLHGLQQQGYGEVALEYIEKIAERADVPVELRQIFDLERSKSYRIAAGEAYDAQQRNHRLAEAKRLADKFFTENPAHPAAGTALLGEADESLMKGQVHLAESRGASEAPVKDQALADARAVLKTALGQYIEAEKRLKEKLDALGPAPEKPTPADSARDELEYAWLESRFKMALCGYLMAQTYSDPKALERTKLLETAGSAFDAIFQEYRGKRVAYLTHLWHGKCVEELGDATLAMDIYDEVLVGAPEGAEADPELAPIFGQAALFRQRLLAATADLKELLAETQEWLQSHKRWQHTSVYQGMSLEAVKARLQAADKARSASEKAKLQRDAIVALAAIGKVESEYRHEAMLLRRETIEKMGTGGEMSFEERLAVGDEAAGDKNWTKAEALFRQAVTQAEAAKDIKKVTAAKQKLAPILYQLVLGHYAAGEMDKVLALCGEIVRDNADQPVAETASAVAVAAALQVYSTAGDDGKESALARLEKIANYAIGRWSAAPVGDDARMALAQAHLIQRQHEPALVLLANVNSESKRYPTALQILGQIRWKQYMDGKKAADAAEREAELKQLREEAVSSLTSSVQRQRASWQVREPMPAPLFDTQLLLAEAHLEGQEAKQSAALYEPLAAELAKTPPTAIDQKVQRVLVGSVRAQLAAGDPVKAGAAAVKLAGLSPDAPQPNSLLVDLSKLFAIEIRKIEAAQNTEGGAPAPAVTVPDSATLKLREVQGQVLDTIAGRQALSVAQLIFVGDTCALLGKNDKAREVYQHLLDNIDHDESAKATAGAAVTRIRSRLLSILRAEGRLPEAEKQVDALIKVQPTALEPLMEKGYILEALAERTPARADECIAHWTKLRLQLGKSRNRLPEYYEVLYNAARCLVRQARKNKVKEKALQAEQMLKSTLTLTPKLSGPEMVIKYETLLKAAITLQGKKPAAAPTPTASPTSTTAPKTGAAPAGAKTPPTATTPVSAKSAKAK